MDEPIAGDESSETTVAEQAPAIQATGGPGSNSAGPGSNSAVALPRSIWTWLLWLQFILLTGVWLSIVAIQDLPNSLDVIDVLFFGLLVWQCEALGFWMGQGRTRWRLLLVPAAAISLALLCSIAAHIAKTLERHFQSLKCHVHICQGMLEGIHYNPSRCFFPALGSKQVKGFSGYHCR